MTVKEIAEVYKLKNLAIDAIQYYNKGTIGPWLESLVGDLKDKGYMYALDQALDYIDYA
jgi:hypothetical protein